MSGRGRRTPDEWREPQEPSNGELQGDGIWNSSPSSDQREEPDERELLFLGTPQEGCDLSLLLASQSRTHWLEEWEGKVAILVPLGRKRIEERLIRAWRRENQGFFSQIKATFPKITPAPLWLLLPPIALFFYERVSPNGALWKEAGLSDAFKISTGGEWHRSITALLLHADLGHLAGNCFWSFLVLTLLHQRLAWPLAAWLTLFSGVFGNISTALLFGAAHRSLGFSTALFGAIGLLAGIEFRHPVDRRRLFLRRATPLMGAALLGVWMGTGEGTDITAHLMGLLWGVVMGFALPQPLLLPQLKFSRLETTLLALSLWVALALAWKVALSALG